MGNYLLQTAMATQNGQKGKNFPALGGRISLCLYLEVDEYEFIQRSLIINYFSLTTVKIGKYF